MSQRFSRKDFSLYLVLASLIGLVLLSMYMVDRQWQMMSKIRSTIGEQARDLNTIRNELRALRQDIERGATLSKDATGPLETAASSSPTFNRALEARQSKDFSEGGWLVRAFGNSLKTITHSCPSNETKRNETKKA